MFITSIYLDTELPKVDGMLNIKDLLVRNFFEGMPALPVSISASDGFYFGPGTTNLADNNIQPDKPGEIHGTLNNSKGYIEVAPSNWLDTKTGSDYVSFSWAAGVIRPVTNPAANAWYFSNFTGVGATGSGWAVGVSSEGKIRAAYQLPGGTLGMAQMEWPSDVLPGQKAAISGIVDKTGRVTIAVYRKSEDSYISSSGNAGGAPVAFGRDIYIGRKYTDNVDHVALGVYALIFWPGDITSQGHVIAQRYIYNM